MNSTVPDGKYQIWGFEANADYDALNKDTSSADQTPERKLVCVYATDDITEAKAIMRNGGFFRDDGTTWVIAREGRKRDGNG